VLDGFASSNPPKPGPQNGRQFSAPITGPTTLKETT
jgi:NADH-quinone oxidoreductase subunit E